MEKTSHENYKEYLSYRLMQSQVLIKRRLISEFQERGYDITFEQWIILTVIYRSPGLIQSEIALKTFKDKTNITRILDVLTKRNYLYRVPHETDRRSLQIYLTPQGEQMIEELIPLTGALNQCFIYGIPEEELKLFYEILERLSDNIQNNEISMWKGACEKVESDSKSNKSARKCRY